MSAADHLPIDAKIPKGSLLDKIEASYGPLDDAVPCGLAGCGQPHRKGFVVIFRKDADSDLERALMGHVCGKREFGTGWTQALARHRAEVRAADVRAELDGVLEKTEGIEPRLRALLPGLEIRSAIRKILLIDARDFMRQCAEACRTHNGQLQVHGFSGKVVTYNLQGHLFFLQDTAFDKAKRLQSGIGQLRAIATQSDTSIPQLKDLLSRFKNLRITIEEIEKESADGIAALQPANFDKAIRVLDPYQTGKVRIVGSVIEVYRLRGPYSEWTEVADLANPQAPAKP